MTRTFVLNSMVVTSLNILSQAASFALFMLIAALFGANEQTDAFFLALSIPILFYGPIVNAVTSVFIPVMTEYRMQRPDVLGCLVGSALVYTTLLAVITSGLVALAFPFILDLTASGITSTVRTAAFQHTLWLLPVLSSQMLIGVMAAVYNSAQRFWLPAGAVVVRHTVAAISIVLLTPTLGIISLSIGFSIGALLQLVLLIGGWRSLHISVVWQWHLDAHIARSFRLMLPIIVGTVMLYIGLTLSRFLAAQLPAGSVSMLDYATRLSHACMELLSSGVMLVALADWSGIVACKDHALLQVRLRQVVTTMLFVIMPAVTGLVVFREPLVALMLERGEFDAANAMLTASVMLWFVLAIPVDIVGRLYARLFLVWQDTWTLGWVAMLRLGGYLVAAIFFMKWFGIQGLALAELLAVSLTTLVLILITSDRCKKNTFAGMLRPLVTLGVMTLICWIAMAAMRDVLREVAVWLTLSLASVAGLSAYLAGAWLLRLQEFTNIMRFLARRYSSPH